MYRFYEEIVPGEPSLRIGSKTPDRSVNLAYVSGPPLVSEDAVELFDYSQRIPENVVPQDTFKTDLFVGPDRRLQDASGKVQFPVENVLVTSIYKSIGDKSVPLYYTYTTRFYHYELDPPIINGYYAGQNIKVLEGDSATSRAYLIELESTSTSGVWRVHIYSEFASSEDFQFVVQYSKCDLQGQNVVHNFEEIYNSTPIYTRTDLESVKSAPDGSRLFAVERSLYQDGYHIYAANDVMVASRNPVVLRWRVRRSDGLYSTWRSDMLLSKNSLHPDEYNNESGVPIYIDDSDGVAKKILCRNVVVLFPTSASSYSYTYEYQLWEGPSFSEGSWVQDTQGKVGMELVGSTLYAYTSVDTGEKPNVYSKIKKAFPPVATDVTIEGYLDPPDVTVIPGKDINVAKLSLGATATSNLNPSDYPISSSPSNAIDGKKPVGFFAEYFNKQGVWFAQSAKTTSPVTAPVTLDIALPSSKTIHRIEIVMGRGRVTKLETVNGGATTVLWANESQVPPPTPVDLLALLGLNANTGRRYVYNAPSGGITCDHIKVTVAPDSMVVRDIQSLFDWILALFGLFHRLYQSAFEVYEVNAFEHTEPSVDVTRWKKVVSFGLRVSANNPAQIDMRNLLDQYGLLPPQGVTLSNVRYKVYLGDRTAESPVDYNALAYLTLNKRNLLVSPQFSQAMYTMPAVDGEAYCTYNDIFGDATKTVVLSILASNEETHIQRRFSAISYRDDRIYILPFRNMGRDEMWHPLINNGRVIRKDIANGKIYDFCIPEFAAQPFYPREPYMYVERERASFVDGITVKVSNRPLYVECDSEGNPTNLKVYIDSGGTITNIPILNWNIYTGEIKLDRRISFADNIFCDYYYTQRFYVYKGFPDSSTGKFYYLDLNPMPGHTYTYPLDATGTERPSSELLNKTVYIYALPYFSYTQTDFSASGAADVVLKHIIVDRTTSESDAMSLIPPNALVLGKIMVKRPAVPTMINVVDTRRLGGGFKEDLSESTIRSLHPEAQSVWDAGLWDGLPYPVNGVIEVTVPRAVLNTLSDKEIRDAINRHVAFGTYVFVQYKD